MTFLLPLIIGVLFFAGAYLMLHRNILRLVVGLSLLSHATNLIIIASGWIGEGGAPIIGASEPPPFVDPIPQALILTAIVISFAVTALMLVLVLKIYGRKKTANVDDLSVQKG